MISVVNGRAVRGRGDYKGDDVEVESNRIKDQARVRTPAARENVFEQFHLEELREVNQIFYSSVCHFSKDWE